jgi:hypothetical protein
VPFKVKTGDWPNLFPHNLESYDGNIHTLEMVCIGKVIEEKEKRK